MKISRSNGQLSLGAEIDPASGEVSENQTDVEASDLTTHGVIVGMTGSGKTGLGMVLLEEALMSDIPVLAIDPKGDLGNLCLNFPDFNATSFEPWMDGTAAKAAGKSTTDMASDTASMWQQGLADWGVDAKQMQKVAASDPTIYTPGSSSGVQLDFLGGLAAPVSADAETLQTEIDATVAGLLNLVGIESDPLSGREHILLANLLNNSWSQGKSLDMATLLTQIQNPPIRKLGVLDIDQFFSPDDRGKLVLKLNGLLASRSFAAWAQGAPIDIQKMLWSESGAAKASIVSLNHLEESERHFAITLLLSKLISWMKTQQGTSELRALIYIDEVMGLAPPSGAPSTKKPILTLLKQARAFGIGLVLSTQNPVDLDYKAISNAGTWMVGRLQTEQDKARLIDGLRSADGATDIKQLEETISSLGKRQFLLKSAKSAATPVFTTRWAMSYLAGPLAPNQVETLMADKKASQPAAASATPAPAAGGQAAPAPTDDSSSALMPDLPEELKVRYVTASTPWLSNDGVDGSSESTKYKPTLAATVEMLFDDTKADLREQTTWEAIIPASAEGFEVGSLVELDHDPRDFTDSAPEGTTYVLPEFSITKTKINSIKSEIKNHLYTSETLTLFKNAELKAWSKPGEDEEAFKARCVQLAEDKADEEAAKIREKLLTKKDRLEDAVSKAEDRVNELKTQKSGRKSHQLLDVGSSVLGSLLGGRSTTSGITSAARKLSSGRKQTADTSARLESALNRLEEKEVDLEELDETIEDSLLEIQEKWEAVAENSEAVEVPLEKTDITISDLVLAWIPTS